ncbi:MAG TPA: LamG-like jellyroll fold domain-containing protein [Pseudobacteroides sp.]|uniref:LamG-like jellyroll fold domain-containing protein n=1 Tax=Pseudobacteroides sp. TaxID=1968840 RepID=UPI002F933494
MDFVYPQTHPIELPPGCVFYVDPDLDQGCTQFKDYAEVYGVSKPRDNLVQNYMMDADSNADGVADGWVKFAGAGITTNFTVEQSSQKIEITASTAGGDAYVSSADIPCVANEAISLSITYKNIGTTTPRLYVLWYTSGSAYISTSTIATLNTSADWVVGINENIIAPATAAKFQVKVGLRVSSIGQTGAGWFKTCVAVKGTTSGQSTDIRPRLNIIDKEVAAPYGTCRYLNGSTDHISSNNHSNIDIISASPQKPLSVYGAFNPDITANTGYIIAKNDTQATDMQYGFYYSGIANSLVLYLNGTQKGTGTPTNSIIKGNWHFAGFTWDGATVKMYINGKLAMTQLHSGVLPSRPNFRIGCRGNNSLYFKGLIGPQLIAQTDFQNIHNWAVKTGLYQRFGIAV